MATVSSIPLQSVELESGSTTSSAQDPVGTVLTESGSALETRAPAHPAPLWLAASIWAIAALYYLIGFYQRVSPAVMTDELMRAFAIGAGSLGNLSAFYFYFYVAMQIPTGILIDLWGARKLLIGGSLVAATGTFLFGFTHSFVLACAGRAIIGGATAVGWVVLLKLTTHWFPAKRFAMLSGLGLLFGNLGALTAQVPLRMAIQAFTWRPVVMVSAAAVLGVGLLALLFVRNDPSDAGYLSHAPAAVQRGHMSTVDLLKGFRRIFGYRNTWLIFLSQGAIVGSILTFTGLWGTPYLRVRYGLTPTEAATVCSVMIACWAASSPLCGALSDKIGRRKPIYVGGCFVAAAGWSCMFFLPALPLAGFIAIAAATCVASGSVVIGFAFGKEAVPMQFLGTISGTVNIGNMVGPMLLQPAVGKVLDHYWSGQIARGVHVYSVAAYQHAFLLLIAWLLLASVLLSLTTETHCRQSA
jgi:sugar phosphate permease